MHNAELNRLINERLESDAVQDALFRRLFQSFGIADMTFEEFEMFLTDEFNELKESNMLPGDPIEVEVNIPAITAGFETLVEDIRSDINKEAEDLKNNLALNQFAETFVCEEMVKDLSELQKIAEDDLYHQHDKLVKDFNDLFIVFGGNFDNRLAFENHLLELFEATKSGDQEQTNADTEEIANSTEDTGAASQETTTATSTTGNTEEITNSTEDTGSSSQETVASTGETGSAETTTTTNSTDSTEEITNITEDTGSAAQETSAPIATTSTTTTATSEATIGTSGEILVNVSNRN